MRTAFFLAVLLTSVAPATCLAQLPSTVPGAGVRPGDIIRMAAWRLPEFTGEYRVGSQGEILHPLLSDVRVTGASEAEIRERILAVLRRYETDPQVVIDLLHRVAVAGEVQQPNVYLLPPETTISQAVATAGGVTTFGTMDRVIVVRDGREIVLDLRGAEPDVLATRIQSGDEIRVSRRRDFFRDYVVPSATLISAVAAIVTLFRIR